MIQNSSGTNTIGSLTNSGTFNCLAGTTLNVTGDLTDDGTITVNSNGDRRHHGVELWRRRSVRHRQRRR